MVEEGHMSLEERESLETIASQLGKELVGVIPGVWGTSLTARPVKEPELKLKVICTEEAKQKVLQKYGDDSYRGHKLYFQISEQGPRFA
ncbi:MAG: hypothetical protein UT65_C0026G0010 [Parcubacteria group bacterium GW2011_GWF2_39_8b]|nr:MAG: hypothetical protein UT65_C0026G0010 [Parcubacteria group bacterium GW2011_GWF2_39_8b]KKR46197.1 MAG: hypothetical protein UT81_C0001G0044 [Parcubacteria group bacterium GW2011_GWA2_40_14]